MPTPSKTPLLDFAKKGAKAGVAVQRFRISKADGEEIKRIEKSEGHAAGCQHLLKLLFQPKPQ